MGYSDSGGSFWRTLIERWKKKLLISHRNICPKNGYEAKQGLYQNGCDVQTTMPVESVCWAHRNHEGMKKALN